MLVLSRDVNERVIITIPPSSKPQRVVVTAVATCGSRTRLGFDAERDVEIFREEIAPPQDTSSAA